MNILKQIVILALGSMWSYSNGCPTCVGKIKLKDEPFFSDTFYKSLQTPYQKKSLLEKDADDDDDDTDENEEDDE